MNKEIAEKIENLEKECKELRDKEHKIQDEIKQLKMIDLHIDKFEGKYIKYKDTYGCDSYIHVDTIMREYTRFTNFDICYMFRGTGFTFEFTGYDDATSFYWDYWYEEYIYGDEREFIKKIDSIEIITEEEFNKAFEEGIKLLQEYHYK